MATAAKIVPEAAETEQDSAVADKSQNVGKDAPRHILKRPIVATNRKIVGTLMQQVMEEMGAKGGQSQVTTAKEAAESLAAQPQSLLFVDWQLGPEIAVQILKEGRNGESLNLRPIVLLIPNVTTELVAIAMEYAVTKVIAGQLTAPALQEQVEQIKKTQENDSTINQQLRKVSDALKAGSKDDAHQMISSLHELNPNDQRVSVEYATYLIEDGKWRDAEAILKPLCTREPPYLRALSAYSRCLLKRGSVNEAETLLKKAKLINPFDVGRLIELGDVLLQNGKTQEAHQNFSEALQMDRGNKDAKMGKATCSLIQDDINSALHLLHEVVTPRELASVFNTSAIMATRDKRFEHAVKLYETATKLVESVPWLIARLSYNQGLAFNKWDKPEEARKHFERAAKADPEFKKAVRSATNTGVAANDDKHDQLEGAEETIVSSPLMRTDKPEPSKTLSSEPKSMMDEIDDFGIDLGSEPSDDE